VNSQVRAQKFLSLKGRWKQLWLISWPLILANSFWNLQVTIDRIFLGSFSTDSLGAAIGAVGLFWAPMALVQQTSAYVTTFVAQYLGQDDKKWIGPCVWQSIYVGVVGGILFLGLIPMAPKLFQWVGHSPAIQILEVDYFQVLALSALPITLVATCSGFFTGLGQSQKVVGINLVGLLFNIFFDYFLIFGKGPIPQMGIVGAGLATALANWMAALFGLYLVFSVKNNQEYQLRQNRSVNWELMGRYIKFGLPSGLQWSLEGLAFTGFLVFVGRLPNGDSALAASGITITIMMLAILPVLGVAQGLSVLVGQSLGQGHPQLARSYTWVSFQMALVYTTTMAISFLLMPHAYLSLFKNTDRLQQWQEVSELVPNLLIFVATFLTFDAMNLIFSFTLKGAGDTRFVSLIALTLPWPVMVLPSWYVSSWSSGVYWAWAAASLFILLQALIFLWRFQQGRWQSMRVT
jgi:multidrug resistance protein, MATE family